VVDLYYQDTSKAITLRQAPKLKYEHFMLNSFSKMRVDLAAQVIQKIVIHTVAIIIIIIVIHYACR